MRPEAEVWWRQATADLVTAQELLVVARDYAASWFAQQAVEKGLKARFVDATGRLVARTHDLEYLGQVTGVPDRIQQDRASLNPAFDLVRYPDPMTGVPLVDAVDDVLAEDHVAAPKRVMAWLDQQLNPQPRKH